MSMEEQQENWQIESGGQIFDTNFAELTALIDRGELFRMDRVRKGNLRWIEAGKVPALLAVFNAKDGDEPSKPVITLTKLGPTSVPGQQTSNRVNAKATTVSEPVNAEPVCSMHDDVPAIYQCGTCFSNFCKTCPKSYGGTVKICPYCGAMCESLEKVEAARTQAVTHTAAMSSGFGFEDLISALAYPFKFKTSLILGAAMYAFFSIGTGAMGFGGIFMMGAALGSYLLANTLTFGVLANTIENFAQGKIGENFMPSFDDFSPWDDVINPFFLSIGVWLSSFGPLILLFVVSFFFVSNAITHEMNGLQDDAARTVVPEMPYAAKAAQQSQAVRELINKSNEAQKKRIEQMQREAEEPYEMQLPPDEPRSIAPEAEEYNRKLNAPAVSQNNVAQNSPAGETNPPIEDTEAAVMRANEAITQMRQAQLEAAVGKSPETKAKEQSALISQLLGYGLLFLLLGGICLLWGLFYFPAACAVAGYTQSFAATVNPAVGFDTIKRLGMDYVKILLMGLVIVVMSAIIGGVISLILSPFDMPGVGNVPARVVTSLFGFYFSIVFSCVLGFAMYKAGDRLKLPS